MLDYRRKFIEAAQRYNELSYKSIVAEDERMQALKKALICTVLASAGWWNKSLAVGFVAFGCDVPSGSSHIFPCFPGQQRSRMLATLFKDERCQQLPAYAILEKMCVPLSLLSNCLANYRRAIFPKLPIFTMFLDVKQLHIISQFTS